MYQNTDIPTRGKFSGSLFAYHSCHSSWCSIKEDITPWNPSSLSSCVTLSQAKSGNQSEIKTFLTWQLFTLYHNTNYARLISHFNPSMWSDGPCPHSKIVACRGVTGSAHILHTAFKYRVEKPSHITEWTGNWMPPSRRVKQITEWQMMLNLTRSDC
jgi:hypothetical protein